MLQQYLSFSRKSLFKYFVLLLTSAMFSSTSEAGAAEIVLEWESPGLYSDGTPLLSLGGFLIYAGTAADKYAQKIDAGELNSYKLTALEDGETYYFSVAAYDSFGNQGELSNELTKTFPPSLTTLADLTITDALSSLKIAVGLSQASEADLVNFDLAPMISGQPAPDGKIDISDALTILRMVVGHQAKITVGTN